MITFFVEVNHHMLLMIVELKSVHFNFKYVVTNDRSIVEVE